MRKILTILMLLCSALFAQPDWAKSYTAALEQAKKENKSVMVMLSRENCDACWYMENIVFEEDDVITELQMDFIPVHIDIYNDRVPEGLSYIGTPTFYFLDADGKKIERHDGAANVQDFTTLMRDVKKQLRK